MAKDERSNAAEKGKGKADDVRELNGDKKETKESKPPVNGKKDEEQKNGTEPLYLPSNSSCLELMDLGMAEDLSEEDQQLKNELEMLVERLQVGDTYSHLKHDVALRHTEPKIIGTRHVPLQTRPRIY
jgi:26S proteasome regulatory subunit N1